MSLIKSIDGTALDFIIKGGTLKVIDGVIYDGLGKDEASISPIGYIKYYDGASNISIPIYNVTDIAYSALRINIPSGIGCFNVVDLNSSLSSQIRIATSTGIKSIALGA